MSIDNLVAIVLVALYVPVCTFVILRLFPGLSLISKLLAIAFLAAIILVLVMAPEQRKPGGSVRVWSLDSENTIPSAIASAQLALVSCVIAVTAATHRKRPLWHRLYLQGLVSIFLFLAVDEYFGMHERIDQWEAPYAVLGTGLVAATLFVAFRMPRISRLWYFCFLSGLAISAAGGLGVEQLGGVEICSATGLYQNEHCLSFVIEESMEFLGIWLTLVAVLGLFSRESRQSSRYVTLLLCLWPMTWLAVIPTKDALHFRDVVALCATLNAAAVIPFMTPPRIYRCLAWLVTLAVLVWSLTYSLPRNIRYLEYRISSDQAILTYDLGITLRVFRLEVGDDSISLQFFSELINWDQYSGLGFSLHLVDQVSGVSIAGGDVSAKRLDSTLFRSRQSNKYVYKQLMTLDIPADAPRNRALLLVLTAWRESGDEYIRQNISFSNYRLLDNAQVILEEVVLRAKPVTTETEPIATFDNGIQLVSIALPAGARAGDTVPITFIWRSDGDIDSDYSQFLHFIREGASDWWGLDQEPLGTRLPTRYWYRGLADSESWHVPLPEDMAPGRYLVSTGLYAQADLNRLPVKDNIGDPFPNARVHLGTFIVENT